jgi:hypothetical protein
MIMLLEHSVVSNGRSHAPINVLSVQLQIITLLWWYCIYIPSRVARERAVAEM